MWPASPLTSRVRFIYFGLGPALGIPQPTSTSITHAGCTGDAPLQSRPHNWSLWGQSRDGEQLCHGRDRPPGKSQNRTPSRLSDPKGENSQRRVWTNSRRALWRRKWGSAGKDAPSPTRPRIIQRSELTVPHTQGACYLPGTLAASSK